MQAIASPTPDLYATLLDPRGMGQARALVAKPARLAGYDVALYASIGHEPGQARSAQYRLLGVIPEDSRPERGLIAFDAHWRATGSPVVRLRFAGWPWRAGTVTELKRLLKPVVSP